LFLILENDIGEELYVRVE